MDPLPDQPECPCPKATNDRLVAWLEGCVLLAMATFLTYSFFSGRINVFVAARYTWFPLATAIGLTAIALARWISPITAADLEPADAPSGNLLPRWVFSGLLLLPIVFGVSVRPGGFSAEGQEKRKQPTQVRHDGVDGAIWWVRSELTPEGELVGPSYTLPETPTVKDLIMAVASGHAKALDGQYVTLVGQCTPLSDDPSGRFDLVRWIVTCCLADATSVSVEVAPAVAKPWSSHAWLEVRGVIRFDGPMGSSVPVLHAAVIAEVSSPQEPYL